MFSNALIFQLPDLFKEESQLYELHRNSESGSLSLQKRPIRRSQTRLWHRIS